MDYFALGGRPLLTRFPPHILSAEHQQRLLDQVIRAQQQQQQQLQSAEEAGGGYPSYVGDASGNQAVGGYPNPSGSSSGPSGYPGGGMGNMPYPGASMSGYEGGYYPYDMRLPPPQASQAAQSSTAPVPPLHSHVREDEVQPWEADNFEMIRKLQDASRNRGHVYLMKDIRNDRLVAVKQMPNRWIGSGHLEFVSEHPSETELPWQDIGCIKLLNDRGYEYGCTLLGVYRDDVHTFVVTTFCTEGDLFVWCEVGDPPGIARERAVWPLVKQIFQGVKELHDMSIVHRDLSLENILLEKGDGDSLLVRIIDFSMSSTNRYFKNCVRGKASYQAPEIHLNDEYDAFLSDGFSLGVTLYALLLKDYPWLSTRVGGCKCFEYVRKHGFRPYLLKRKLRNTDHRVAEYMSEPLQQLLEGLLAFDTSKRLTLGERAWDVPGQPTRKSVWDEPWLKIGPDAVREAG
eukprot:TRINITY_DN1591_c2_g1_i1.p1 TRINITY_DN1591_c2_g1~~TRINITY_DN1591_c2_g1_i1.p1  ORF type:complete len:459 (-),score=58.37 TRINITY_DN1591_c2_g1_i1:195-1571(-)